ncbi:hypothetical protein GLAREA_02498 [Glarea lozoyensis ATCC 20868]|uniref:Uncharacterized protein n=2 Tax=Glarea lozoyensis TaxID=101852 RepID=S3CLF7_GLAL2|nr:uncharacterized protein GLAREA_02498 [Glarea lozoyensis ATCC 20868]EPE26585.1 hypothetical protein GLAREA_02498 [Glarea lozoyensis ATCC 20868]
MAQTTSNNTEGSLQKDLEVERIGVVPSLPPQMIAEEDVKVADEEMFPATVV